MYQEDSTPWDSSSTAGFKDPIKTVRLQRGIIGKLDYQGLAKFTY